MVSLRMPAAEGASSTPTPSDSLRISLITCWPGPEIYELAGHEAIRVKSPDFDYVWNYGTFDFNQPNFIGRFVSGQTDYKVLAYPFQYFLPEYQERGSKVMEQELLLTPEEKQRLLEALRRNALPQNATYRYNYVKDNCATRITAMLDSTLDRKIIFPDTVRYGSFRRVMRNYHHDYLWYQFGIDLVLGSGLDYPITRRQEMFAPVEMYEAYSTARFAGSGLPVTSSPIVLYEGRGDATLGPTPWYLTPLAVSIAVFIVSCGVWLYWAKWKRLARWWFSLYFGVCGLGGCLVTYLVFFSAHEATSPNLFILWLNPLQWLIGFGVWWRSWRWPALAMAFYNAVALPILLIAWPSQPQVGSAPIFIFMASAILLSVVYIIISLKYSYYTNRLATNKGYDPGFLRAPSKSAGTTKKGSRTSTRGRKK